MIWRNTTQIKEISKMDSRRYSSATELQTQERLQQKLRELENLREVKKLTSKLSSSLEEFNSQMEKVNNGSACVSDVTSNWNQIVRAISLATNTMMSSSAGTQTDGSNDERDVKTERLVRCNLDDNGKISEKNET